jgi:hypothetical protein
MNLKKMFNQLSTSTITNFKKLASSSSNKNTLLHGRLQADESENLELLLPGRKQTSHKAFCSHPSQMSPRSEPFPQTAELP